MNSIKKAYVGDLSQGRPEGSLFNSYYTEVYGEGATPFPELFHLPLIRTLYCRVLSKEVSSTILKIFDMTRPGIEPRSRRIIGEHSTHLANSCLKKTFKKLQF